MVPRAALTAVENCRQSKDDPSYGGIILRLTAIFAVNSVLDLIIIIMKFVWRLYIAVLSDLSIRARLRY